MLLAAATGCAGGTPLLHPARTLERGDVRAAAGLSGEAVVGSLADDLHAAREDAAKNPNAPGPAGTNPVYAKGALVAAAVAPGLAPFVGARVGVGSGLEGGVGYTGRGARIDMRRGLDLNETVTLSIGAGVSGAFYGHQQGGAIPGVDLGSLHGYGADIPIVIGWESDGGLYRLWLGARAGYEHAAIGTVTSEPKSSSLQSPPLTLSANRWWGGGLIGLAAGFRHVHVALELDVTYQSVSGSFNQTDVTVAGLSLVPATALWWSF
jgi:hypothetical protein